MDEKELNRLYLHSENTLHYETMNENIMNDCIANELDQRLIDELTGNVKTPELLKLNNDTPITYTDLGFGMRNTFTCAYYYNKKYIDIEFGINISYNTGILNVRLNRDELFKQLVTRYGILDEHHEHFLVMLFGRNYKPSLLAAECIDFEMRIKHINGKLIIDNNLWNICLAMIIYQLNDIENNMRTYESIYQRVLGRY